MEPFVHSALLWGLPLVGVPVLIHLINLLRHRRVRWAAMEFLLRSQRKNRTRVMLKQLLLLLMRMTAVGVVVLMVAQPRLGAQWGRLFGTRQVHHVVLLDDSFSMSDRWEGMSAFERAKGVVGRIARAVVEEGPQQFTLLRFSHARRTQPEGTRVPGRAPRPDLFEQTVDADFAERLEATTAGWAPSESDAGPAAALEALDELLADAGPSDRAVYVVSDFRARDWDAAGPMRQRLLQWKRAGVKVHLVNCVDAARPNLAISGLTPAPGIWASGVFSFMDVAVQNHSPKPVRDVRVLVEVDGLAQPALTIAEIPAQKAVRERFPVRFATSGEHRVIARLEPDAVAADNARYAVLDVPRELPVLLVDGDPSGRDARYLTAALAPGGPVATGISPKTEAPRYLSTHALGAFRTIYLLNVDQLEEPAVAALEKYVSAGGGLAFFLGERSQNRALGRRLYAGGKGLLPVPLGDPEDLKVDLLQRLPDLEVTSHPIFEVFAGERNSFLPLVSVRRYFAVDRTWRPEAQRGRAEGNGPARAARVIARLRNGAPLAVEREFGRGRVVAFLTTAAPVWNNWARENPSFVVAMLELQAYLGGRPPDRESCLVDESLRFPLDAGQYAAQVRFTKPRNEKTSERANGPPKPPVAAVAGEAASAGAAQDEARRPVLVDAASGPDGTRTVSLDDTDVAGFYEAVLLAKQSGKEEVRHYAVNVESGEGDLRTIWGPDLASRLKDTDCEFHQADAYRYAGPEQAGSNLGLMLLYVLIALLVAEQLLAYSASYHPPGSGGTRGGTDSHSAGRSRPGFQSAQGNDGLQSRPATGRGADWQSAPRADGTEARPATAGWRSPGGAP